MKATILPGKDNEGADFEDANTYLNDLISAMLNTARSRTKIFNRSVRDVPHPVTLISLTCHLRSSFSSSKRRTNRSVSSSFVSLSLNSIERWSIGSTSLLQNLETRAKFSKECGDSLSIFNTSVS